jgi:glycosyltransferase involved in cell wall biosynthesis
VPSCLLFDPYLTALGGGERYIVAMAQAIATRCDVTLAAPALPEPALWRRLGFPDDVRIVEMPIEAFPAASAHHDVAVFLANRLPLPSRANTSVLVVQFPFVELDTTPHRRGHAAARLSSYHCVTYSAYADHWLQRRWGVGSRVIAPPVELGTGDLGAKGRTIISVGRFFSGGHTKRQDALVDAFRCLPEDVRSSWRLVLVGGVGTDENARRYLDGVRAAAAGLAVEIRTNVDQAELDDLYAQASLAWHATGFGRDHAAPEQAEHFGIAVVEAMSWGAVPLVYDDGGPATIVGDEWGVRWTTLDELVGATSRLARDDAHRQALAGRAVPEARRYGRDHFDAQVVALIDELLDGTSAPEHAP